MSRHDTKIEQNFWGNLAKSQEPEFSLTATFKRPYADTVSIEAFKFALRAIQRRIPSRRVLRGVATLERTRKNAHFEGRLHLHSLLWGVVGNVREPEQFLTQVVTEAFLKLRDAQGRRMTRKNNIKLQYVYEPAGAAGYNTKDLGKSESRRSRVWLITSKGLDTTTDYFN